MPYRSWLHNHPVVRNQVVIAMTFLFSLLALASMALGGLLGYLSVIPPLQTLDDYTPPGITRVFDRTGNVELAQFFEQRREVVRLDDVPLHVINAFLAIEDERFYSHFGVDLKSIARAVMVDIKQRQAAQGASTITMQVARNVVLQEKRKKWTRKLREVILAFYIERHYSKEQILEFYLNQIFFGARAYGVQAASKAYFNKDVKDLTLAEGALLAGLPKAPSELSPFRDKERARARRNLVLANMHRLGYIRTPEELSRYEQSPIVLNPPPPLQQVAPYYADYVRSVLMSEHSMRESSQLGEKALTVVSAVNLEMQRIVEEELRLGIERVQKMSGKPKAAARRGKRTFGASHVQGGAVLLDAKTGEVLAVAGGKDFNDADNDGQWNRAVQGGRQPGSSWKPLLYASALDLTDPATGKPRYTPSSVILDAPFSVGNWAPKNYDGGFRGAMSLYQALVHSRNIPTVKLFYEIGPKEAVRLYHRFNLVQRPSHWVLPAVGPLSLGTPNITPLELTAAYQIFANQGKGIPPRAVRQIVSSYDPASSYKNKPEEIQVISPEAAYITTRILMDAARIGTARETVGKWQDQERAKGRPIPEIAGKTGTTNESMAAWFVGYTPDLVLGIYFGYDQQRSLGDKMTGGRVVGPTWVAMMDRLLKTRDNWQLRFDVPAGIEFQDVCTGGQYFAKAPFKRGSAPPGGCSPAVWQTDIDASEYPDMPPPAQDQPAAYAPGFAPRQAPYAPTASWGAAPGGPPPQARFPASPQPPPAWTRGGPQPQSASPRFEASRRSPPPSQSETPRSSPQNRASRQRR